MQKTLKTIYERLRDSAEVDLSVSLYVDKNRPDAPDAVGIRWEECPDITLFHSQDVKVEDGSIIFNIATSTILNKLLKSQRWAIGGKTSQELRLRKNERRGYSLIFPQNGKTKYKLQLVKAEKDAP